MIEQLGQYQIISELGRGGMGVVLKAHDPELNREVAIKVLSQQILHDETLIQRFKREARSAARLNHPNIVQIYQIGQHQGQHYFVMEFVEGESLSQLLRREKRLTPRQAAEILFQTASALAAAHDHDIIHRDIKPGNIMLNHKGIAKVADFGIAYMPDTEKRLTSTGHIMGTPGYLSPEVCTGEMTDHRSDIFSLGIVYFEMLSGRLPFHSDSPYGLIHQVVQNEVPDIRQINGDVDDASYAILSRMVHKQVDSRYGDCHAILQDLEQGPLEGKPPSLAGGTALSGLLTAPAPGPSAETRRVSDDQLSPTVPNSVPDSMRFEEPTPVSGQAAPPPLPESQRAEMAATEKISSPEPPPLPKTEVGAALPATQVAAAASSPPLAPTVQAVAPPDALGAHQVSPPRPGQARRRSSLLIPLLLIAAVFVMATGVGAWVFKDSLMGIIRGEQSTENGKNSNEQANVTLQNGELLQGGGPREGAENRTQSNEGNPQQESDRSAQANQGSPSSGSQNENSRETTTAQNTPIRQEEGNSGQALTHVDRLEPGKSAGTGNLTRPSEGNETDVSQPKRSFDPENPRIAVIVAGDPAVAQPLTSILETNLDLDQFQVLNDHELTGIATDEDPVPMGRQLYRNGADVMVFVRLDALDQRSVRAGRQSAEVYASRANLRVFRLSDGKLLNSRWSKQFEYTSLNAETKAEDLARGIGDEVYKLFKK